MNIKATILEGWRGSTAVRASITADGLHRGVVKLLQRAEGGPWRQYGSPPRWTSSIATWLDTLDDAPAAVTEIERVVTKAAEAAIEPVRPARRRPEVYLEGNTTKTRMLPTTSPKETR